ncbi:DUF2868 domain-containing protein [Sulfurovum sp. XGS-02]|uniref:DUF2868 domain-containing protein n=1 Tax=Sulfurovum sp. XGS-02 TaxID=2925411 RepID=UPI002060C295|nr:DUF2868 domain-containing protein [Sulfurovum sp. XGS-02]UPT77984.1 DUF2868 domain-containing protein [Sulfurovum sp. XGS-02]
MHIKTYVNLYELLALDPATREENRAFGLTHVMLKNKPIEQLLAWVEKHQSRLKKPLLSDTFSSYLYRVTFVLVLIAFALGLLSGVALLSYSGDEPVNVIYFMAVTVFLPIFTMLLTFFAMFRTRSAENVLIHLSPAFWMEKIMGVLPGRAEEQIKGVKINPLLANWIIIKRSQIIVLFFSLGLLLALLGVIVTKDIAFAWSTTLHISPEEFQRFLHTIAFPWREFAASAVPSLELIEQSQYFRLGTTLDEEMIAHASDLGEWWKFLALSTLWYAIFLRFCIFILASFGLRSAIKKSLFTLHGTAQLLREINEPIISTHADRNEKVVLSGDGKYGRIVNTLDASYDGIQGWAIPHDALLVLAESRKIIAPVQCEVGGRNTLEEDTEIIFKSHGEILLFVKAWEPPTMDFVDYLSELTRRVDKVIVAPVGTAENHYEASPKALDVWENKLSMLSDRKVWLKRSGTEAPGKEAHNA